MKKTNVLAIVSLILIIGLFALCQPLQKDQRREGESSKTQHNNPREKVSSSTEEITKQKVSTQKDSELYTNDTFNYTFQLPKDWSKYGVSNDVIDRNGEVLANEIRFHDSSGKGSLLLVKRTNQAGVNRFKTKLSEFKSSEGFYEKEKKKFLIDGVVAISSNRIIEKNGKGHVLNPKERIIIVDFLNETANMSIEFQFRSPILKNNKEVDMLNEILSTFEFINHEPTQK